MEGRNIQHHPLPAPEPCIVWEPTSPFSPCVRSHTRDDMSLATIFLGPPSLSNHYSWQTTFLGFPSLGFRGSLLPALPAPELEHPQVHSHGLGPATSLCLHSTFCSHQSSSSEGRGFVCPAHEGYPAQTKRRAVGTPSPELPGSLKEEKSCFWAKLT